jgi:hypothetical protein
MSISDPKGYKNEFSKAPKGESADARKERQKKFYHQQRLDAEARGDQAEVNQVYKKLGQKAPDVRSRAPKATPAPKTEAKSAAPKAGPSPTPTPKAAPKEAVKAPANKGGDDFGSRMSRGMSDAGNWVGQHKGEIGETALGIGATALAGPILGRVAGPAVKLAGRAFGGAGKYAGEAMGGAAKKTADVFSRWGKGAARTGTEGAAKTAEVDATKGVAEKMSRAGAHSEPMKNVTPKAAEAPTGEKFKRATPQSSTITKEGRAVAEKGGQLAQRGDGFEQYRAKTGKVSAVKKAAKPEAPKAEAPSKPAPSAAPAKAESPAPQKPVEQAAPQASAPQAATPETPAATAEKPAKVKKPKKPAFEYKPENTTPEDLKAIQAWHASPRGSNARKMNNPESLWDRLSPQAKAHYNANKEAFKSAKPKAGAAEAPAPAPASAPAAAPEKPASAPAASKAPIPATEDSTIVRSLWNASKGTNDAARKYYRDLIGKATPEEHARHNAHLEALAADPKFKLPPKSSGGGVMEDIVKKAAEADK